MPARAAVRRLTALARAARGELGVVAALLVLALGGYGFLGIAEEVAEGDTAIADRRLLLALRARATRRTRWGRAGSRSPPPPRSARSPC